MEWLENLLKEAVITDGKLDVQTLMAAIKKEFPNHAVPKSDFNTVSEAKKKLEDDIKIRDKQLEDLKKENGDAEELQKQIKTLQEQNKEAKKKHDADMKDLRLSNAIKLALTGKVQDEEIVAGLINREKLVLGDDGKVVGLDEQVKALRESKTFLFKEQNQRYNPAYGGGSGESNPFAKETFNMTKQGELFKSNPEQARALAAAAGVTI